MLGNNTTTLNYTAERSEDEHCGTLWWLAVLQTVLSVLLVANATLSICGVIFSEFDKIAKICSVDISISAIVTGVSISPILQLLGLNCDQTLSGVSRCYIGLGFQLFVILGYYVASFLRGILIWRTLENPLHSFSPKHAVLVLVSGWAFVTVYTGTATTVFVLRPEVVVLTGTKPKNCGWSLYRRPFIFGTIYGFLAPPFIIGLISFGRALNMTRKHGRQIAASVNDDENKNTKRRVWTFVMILFFWLALIVLLMTMLHQSHNLEDWEFNSYYLLFCGIVWLNCLFSCRNRTIKAGLLNAWRAMKNRLARDG